MRGICQKDTKDKRAPTGRIWELSIKYILTVTGNPLKKRGIHPDNIHEAMDHTDNPAPNSYGRDLIWNFDGIWKWNLWVIIRFRSGHMGRTLLMELVISAITRTGTNELAFSPHPQTLPFEDIVRRQKSTSQEADPQQRTKWPAPWSWTSQPPKLWEMNSHYSSHPVYSISLWKSKPIPRHNT